LNLSQVTPLVLTHNEEANLSRVLAALSWAERIIVIDSGSTDRTQGIAAAYGNVHCIVRPFDTHSQQWNYGLQQTSTEWALALDADYICPEGLQQELAGLVGDVDAYAADFIYKLAGKCLRGTLYPPRVVLFKTNRFRFVQDGHTQLLDLNGASCGALRNKILHDDRKPLSRWLAAQANYAALEADKLKNTPRNEISWKDRLRRGVLLAPPLTLVYCLFWKRLILDGWPGIYYSLQRTYAELLLSLELVDRRLRGKAVSGQPSAISKKEISEGGQSSTALGVTKAAVDDERSAAPAEAPA
jgi:glycosyltransferase involved in cell wall biosynthesis